MIECVMKDVSTSDVENRLHGIDSNNKSGLTVRSAAYG